MSIPYDKLAILPSSSPPPPRIEKHPFAIGLNRAVTVDPPVILGPMAAVTNAPYRKLCRELGAGLVVTEMVSAELLIHKARKSRQLLDLRDDEAPVSVQLYGKHPHQLADAAKICEDAGADAVDLNMGCPMRKVVASGHGAALLRNPVHVEAIYSAMSAAVAIPVTAKIRAGFEDVNAVDVANAIEQGGGAAITIHGRTRCEKYDGHADLSLIAQVKASVSIPVIGNGDVRDYASARRMFHQTGCDGVMVARGCLGNPWIFAEIAADLHGLDPLLYRNPLLDLDTCDADTRDRKLQQVFDVIARHVDLYIQTFGIFRTSREIRKHLLWYFRETLHEKRMRELLRDIDDRDAILNAVRQTLDAFR